MTPILIVYHDGSCPVCRLEIAHFKQQLGADAINFIDVSDPAAETGAELPRERAMGRLYVRLPSGELRSGGAAFVEIWHLLPLYRPAALFSRLPGAMRLLDAGYELASPLRPLAGRFLKYVV